MEGFANLFDPDRLLLTRRAGYQNAEPFMHGSVDNYLPEGLYRELAGCFPSEPLWFHYSAASTAADKQKQHRFLSDNPAWKALFEFFGSKPFLVDVQHHLYSGRRGDGETWMPVDEETDEEPRNGIPVRITFKLSSMGRGDWIQPHTDNPKKIVSLLLYFADPDWNASFGGGSEIYAPKHALLKRNWHNIDVPFESMIRLHTFAFVPNRLVFLLKTRNSWHGVSPLTCPSGKRRKSLLVTIQHVGEVESPLEARFYRILKSKAQRRIRARMRKGPVS